MKKLNKAADWPPLLATFHATNPHESWESFRDSDNGYDQVKTRLRLDQRELCAYCEIRMATFNGQGLDDFRVEHFHPKKPHSPPPNHALNWQNLLAVCCGGNSKDIGDPTLFTTPNHSCDVPKENKNLTGTILDPLVDIPAFPALFEYTEHGDMAVSTDCPQALFQKAANTIVELLLNPSPTKSAPNPRLRRLRKTAIESLAAQLTDVLAENENDLDAAVQWLCEVHFPENAAEAWPNFFSCIRWYFGPAAERRLTAIGYTG